MIRRAHQIAISLFELECSKLGVTNTQFGAMFMLRARPGIDQATLARLMGLDRSTAGLVVRKLQEGGYVTRRPGSEDRRRNILTLTPRGEQMLGKLKDPARKAQERLLSVFGPREAEEFMALLGKLVASFNESIRTPILPTG